MIIECVSRSDHKPPSLPAANNHRSLLLSLDTTVLALLLDWADPLHPRTQSTASDMYLSWFSGCIFCTIFDIPASFSRDEILVSMQNFACFWATSWHVLAIHFFPNFVQEDQQMHSFFFLNSRESLPLDDFSHLIRQPCHVSECQLVCPCATLLGNPWTE